MALHWIESQISAVAYTYMQTGGEAARSLCSRSTCVPSSLLFSPALSAAMVANRRWSGPKNLAKGAVTELTT